MQRRPIHTRVSYKVFYSACKETSYKPFKIAAAKASFSSENKWKKLFFIKIYCYPEVWYNRHVATFFETGVLREAHILYPLSLQ